MNDEPEIINEKRMILGGFVYVRSRKPTNNRNYWECQKLRNNECSARAITISGNGIVTVVKGPAESPHSHAPNREVAEAEKVKLKLKNVDEKDKRPGSAIVREALAGVSSGVLSQLPERENLKQALRRVRKDPDDVRPTSLADFQDIPEHLKKTLTEECFLIYDSRDHGLPAAERILVFATRKNLDLLASSSTWFLDGTFKVLQFWNWNYLYVLTASRLQVAPHIFTQVFTILGTITRNTQKGTEVVALPFIYSLLSSKESAQYATVMRAAVSKSEEYGIQCQPELIMTDFELAILNACREVFPYTALSACFFHLCQSLYRNIQSHGLQVAYNNAEDRTIKDFAHKLAALAYVPIGDVEGFFEILKTKAPASMAEYVAYFDATYVTGVRARGRRAARDARYPIQIWNQYDAALEGKAKTNNVSEGWHNRFQLLMGKNHPDVFAFIREMQKEQGDTEIAVVELSLGRRVKAAPKKKWLEVQARQQRIVLNFNSYQPLDYLQAIADTIVL